MPMRILIVEDEALIALNLETTLRDAEYIVVGIAANFNQAQKIIDEGCPDLALVNINLKEDRGAGINVARYLLEHCGVASLFVSGQLMEARANRDVALGYVHKPYSSKTILDSVEIARQIMQGEKRNQSPAGLEIFHDDPGEKQT